VNLKLAIPSLFCNYDGVEGDGEAEAKIEQLIKDCRLLQLRDLQLSGAFWATIQCFPKWPCCRNGRLAGLRRG
jgi:hypothetical protein